MSTRIVTVIDVRVAVDREQALLDGFTQLNEGTRPEGLLRRAPSRPGRRLAHSIHVARQEGPHGRA